ncbi:unnamed protein product, partial [Mesorhabditis belari]|uniref:Uncharacterized protein n=1 Tax=Mesorhabditis belari TaxID=2138241 RepID=A0AAF3F9M2_9BILA
MRPIQLLTDPKRPKASASLEADIEKLDGQVVYSINKESSPVLPVSDHSLAERPETLPDLLKQPQLEAGGQHVEHVMSQVVEAVWDSIWEVDRRDDFGYLANMPNRKRLNR